MKHTIPYSSIIVTGSISWDIIMNFPSKFVDYLQPDMLHQINVSFVVNSLEKQMGGTGTNIAFAVSEAAKAIQILNSPSTMLRINKSKTLNKLEIQNSKQLDCHPELVYTGTTVPCVSGSFKMPKQVRHDIKIYLLGGIGKDGKEQIKFFKKNGIKTEGIVSDKNIYCASGTVITDMKDNQIWGFYYGACTRGKDVDFKRFVKKDSVMIISANHPGAFLAAQSYAIKNNITYMYDCGMAMSWIQKKDLQKGIENSSWLIGNDYEIALICKTLDISVKDLVKNGIQVITTLGEKGVSYNANIENLNSKSETLNSKQIINHKFQKLKNQATKKPNNQLTKQLSNQRLTITIPAYSVKKVVDPTGAGDAWRGGFLAAFCSGADIQTCLKIGNVMASFAIESYGTVNYKVNRREFEARLRCLKS